MIRAHLVQIGGWLLAYALGAAADPGFQVRILSGRPDMVTGGNALIEVSGPPLNKTRIAVNGNDVTSRFRPSRITGTLLGRVEELKLGDNTLELRAGSKTVRLNLINHPITGPLFSGPHQTPFICQTEAAGLGSALDADCSAKTAVTYFYKSTEWREADRNAPSTGIPAGFKPFDPSGPWPHDLAKTVTTEGKTVNYIVRWERGTINRAIYEIAFLHEPGQPLPDPWTDSPGWNRRLIYAFDGGCGAGYHQGLPPGGMGDPVISRGYAKAGSSLNYFGNNCDDVISAETAVMVKEYFIKTFGVPVRTIGWGGSGGAMQQYLIAQNYPGVLDGIIPSGSFPDTVTLVSHIDCSLLERAFDHSAEPWTDEEKTAVSGYANWKTWLNWKEKPFANSYRPENCDVSIPKAQVYDPVRNPKGVRCSLQDNQVNVYGRDPKTGFARRVFDNTGVQYGLAAFNAGRISAEKFLDLNERIGGYDPDGNATSMRSAADPEALRISYRTGRVNSARRLGSIPIIDTRKYVDTEANNHDRVRSFIFQARLKRANGRTDNLVILTNPQNLQLAELMDRWLDGIANDQSKDSAETKVARHKPAELADACWTADGERIAEPASYRGVGRCNQLYPAHEDPRLIAGAPLTNDVLKCVLKPVDPKDYRQSFSDAQVARLDDIFPNGVCYYSRPGVEQQNAAEPWLTYQRAPPQPVKPVSSAGTHDMEGQSPP